MLAEIRICSNGTIRFWNENDDYHRIDGHAIEHTDGSKVWYINGKCHRLDGPAIEHADGSKAWFINDKQYTEERFNEIVGGLC